MSSIIYAENLIDPMETYRLAETVDLLYRKLRNVGYSRRYAEHILPDNHTAIQAAAARIIKTVPVGVRPAKYVNKHNLAVLRIVTMSAKRVVCLGGEGRVYGALRGKLFGDDRFVPTATSLRPSFILVSSKNNRELKRVAILHPTLDYIN